MDARQLRAFVTLAELGRYHLAAARLCITQPALSKQIQGLELQLGVRLFERGRQGAQLTAYAEALFPRARALLTQYEQFHQYELQVVKGAAGHLALGFGLSSFHLAPQLVAVFRQHYPAVTVGLEDLSSERQCQLLLEGTLQAGFVRLPVAAPLQVQPLLNDQLVVAVPQALALSVDQVMAEFHRLPLLQLVPSRGPGLSEQTLRFIAAHGLKANALQQAEDIQTLLALVAAGVGIALLPQSITYIAPAGVTILPLTGEQTQWQVGLAWAPQRPDTLRDNFIQLVLKNAPVLTDI
ncbi:LysR family transcriptional regulator [Serratia sp. S1B]|nr:LysR family transcriptional regulator [Serratia sp. S1B]